MFKKLFFLLTTTATLGGIYIYHTYLKDDLENLEREDEEKEKLVIPEEKDSKKLKVEEDGKSKTSNPGGVSYGLERII